MENSSDYNYDTSNFDRNAAFNFVISRPEFDGLLRKPEAHINYYMNMSAKIVDLMKLSHKRRQDLALASTEFTHQVNAHRLLAMRSLMASIVILSLSYIEPLAAYQSVIWICLLAFFLFCVIAPIVKLINTAAHDDVGVQHHMNSIFQVETAITKIYTMIDTINGMDPNVDNIETFIPKNFSSPTIN